MSKTKVEELSLEEIEEEIEETLDHIKGIKWAIEQEEEQLDKIRQGVNRQKLYLAKNKRILAKLEAKKEKLTLHNW